MTNGTQCGFGIKICIIIGVIQTVIVIGLIYWKFFMIPEPPSYYGYPPSGGYGPPPPAAPAPAEDAYDH